MLQKRGGPVLQVVNVKEYLAVGNSGKSTATGQNELPTILPSLHLSFTIAWF